MRRSLRLYFKKDFEPCFSCTRRVLKIVHIADDDHFWVSCLPAVRFCTCFIITPLPDIKDIYGIGGRMVEIARNFGMS